MRRITFGSEESYSRYFVFKKGIQNPKRILENMGIDTDRTWNQTPYDCTGRWYHSSVDFMLKGKWIIGVQRYWLDI